MFTFEGLVLEFSSGEFQGNEWAKIKVRSKEVLDERILSYKVSVKEAGNLSDFKDKECQITVAIARGENDTAVLKVVKVAEA